MSHRGNGVRNSRNRPCFLLSALMFYIFVSISHFYPPPPLFLISPTTDLKQNNLYKYSARLALTILNSFFCLF